MREAFKNIKYLEWDRSETVVRVYQRTKNDYVGIDEVACSAIAGELVGAGVILPHDHGIVELPVDSKNLSEEEVHRIANKIRERATLIYVVSMSPEGVSKRRVEKAKEQVWSGIIAKARGQMHGLTFLIDGGKRLRRDYVDNLVKGDSIDENISAAAVLAKDVSNRYMREAELKYPGYAFGTHKGYKTKEHVRAIKKLGLCDYHRLLAKRCVTQKEKKEEAQLSVGKLEEMIAHLMRVAEQKPGSLNAWEINFAKEMWQLTHERGLAPSTRSQYFIQKTYDKVKKIRVERPMTPLEIRNLFQDMWSAINENPDIINASAKKELDTMLSQMKSGVMLDTHQQKELKNYHEMIMKDHLLMAI